MKTIKADDFVGTATLGNLEYTFNGKKHYVDGEFYLNRKKGRIEYTHIGVRGGEYLVVYPYKLD